MESNITYFIVIIISSIFILKTLLTKNRAKKKYPPSPPSLPIIGHLHLCKKPLHHALTRISNRYGPVFFLRFGSRPVLVVSSASAAQECFTKNDIIFANRVQFPSTKDLTFNYSTLGTSNYGPHWRNMRRIATIELLSAHRASLFSDIRSAEVRKLIKSLLAVADSNGSFTKVELKARLAEFSVNILMRMITGKRSEKMEQATKEFQDSIEEVFSVAAPSNLGDFIPIFRWINFQGLQSTLKHNGDFRNGVMQKMLDEYRVKIEKSNGVDEERTMMGVLLSLQKNEPEYYTDVIIKALINDLLLAGVDTLSCTIEWAMTLLLNNPDKLKKLQNEIKEHINNERLLQESDLAKLPYLQAVIKETLRLCPPAPLLIPHESSDECVVGGYDVPKKTMLIVNVYSIQRDKDIWENAEEFVPERFLNAGKDASKLILPFGMGRRSCPGEHLGYLMLGLVLGTVMQCFEWRRVGDELIDMDVGTGITLSKKVSLQALLKPKDSLSVLSNL